MEQWTRNELVAAQAAALRELRAFAIARSPFYQRLHRGLEDNPLTELPAFTKRQDGRNKPRFEYWVQIAGDGTIFDYGTSHSPDSIGSVQHGFESHGSEDPKALALVDALQTAADKTNGL